MEESKELKQLYTMLQGAVYLAICFEVMVYFGKQMPLYPSVKEILDRIATFPIYRNILWSKGFTLLLIIIVATGTKAKKDLTWDAKKHIVLPLYLGSILFLGSILALEIKSTKYILFHLTLPQMCYVITSFVGAILLQVGADNVSKRIKTGLMKDRFNLDNEAFEQTKEKVDTQQSVNIPMQFYHKEKYNKGYINIVNPFRGTLLLGTPGSGKSFSVVNSFIRQHSDKGFMLAVYDFKFPDLAKLAYLKYNQNRTLNRIPANTQFHVINLTDVEYSRRVNPLKSMYILTLADAQETAEALIEALKKGHTQAGADQFFSQSAINFLSATIYFFAKYEQGKYSQFPHIMAFLNQNYETIFKVLFSEMEISSLLSPFKTAYDNKAFDQLEGQIGTLKIHISRLATKEAFWVFGGDDFDLSISNPLSPAYLIIANNPQTQNVNSASNTLILTRLVRRINTKGNLPCSLIIDEAPTLYFHRLENLMATARSNKVSTLLGLQELPQLKQQYGRETAETICAICGNVISGSVRNKDTLDWLEKLFGKVKQVKESVSINRNNTTISQNENMDYLIPSAKIANLNTGELVAKVALDAENTDLSRDYREGVSYTPNAYNCRVTLDLEAIEKEEKSYIDMPKYYNFKEQKEAILKENMLRINREVRTICERFLHTIS
jgi:hypothetical protein